MNKPVRIQRKCTKGWKMPPNTVYVGRPTKWGNPFIAGHHCANKREAVILYREWLSTHFREWLTAELMELEGKNLCCWCKIDSPCHADVLLELANR